MNGRAGSVVRRGADRLSSSRRLKRVLLSLLLVGALGTVTVQRTYALLAGDEANPAATASSGTLTFDAVVGTGSACFSNSGPSSPGNVNTSCDALFTYDPATEYYPGDSATAQVRIRNDGSLGASGLSLYMPSCTAGTTGDAPAPGGGDPCAAGGAEIYVQETASDGTTPVTCWYPAGTTTCSFAADTLHGFAQTYASSAAALDLGGGPPALQTRYFTIGIALPSTAVNTLQGEEAVFSLTWHMTS
jgi:hypothetical protein